MTNQILIIYKFTELYHNFEELCLDLNFNIIFVENEKSLNEKVENFLNSPFDSINFGDISNLKINDDTFIYWGDEPVGKLKKGNSKLVSVCT